MVSTMTPERSLMEDWKMIFPDFTTMEGSVLFIKKMICVSLSAITYVRGIFPDQAYGERHLYGLKLKLLSEKSGLVTVTKFINLIRSIYDAVEKKYLEQLTVGICTNPENRDEVIEEFNLVFRYRDDEYSVSCKNGQTFTPNEDPTVAGTLTLLRNICSVSEALGPLPEKAYLTMKLLYYDDVTPPDYEPPGFEKSTTEKFTYPTRTQKIFLGHIKTEMHRFKFYLKTTLAKLQNQIEDSSVLTDSQKSEEKTEVSRKNPINNEDNQEELSAAQASTLAKPSGYQDNEDVANDSVECPCACKEDGNLNIIPCTACGRKQHAACYGILNVPENLSDFYCIICFPILSSCSPPDLIYYYSGEEQQELCAMRRALVLCLNVKSISMNTLEKNLGCSKELGKALTERLKFEGFIKKTSRNRFIVCSEKITGYGFQEYFPKYENKENIISSKKKTLSRIKKRTLDNSGPENVYRSPKRSDCTELIGTGSSGDLFDSLPSKRKV